MIVAIAHTKGGTGKSTLVWNLAHSVTDRPVTIIDVDFQQTCVILNGMGGKKMNVQQPKTPGELIKMIEAIPKEELVIIDVGGYDSDMTRAAIKYSDKTIIPITDDSAMEAIGFKTFEKILKLIETQTQYSFLLYKTNPITQNFDFIHEILDYAGIPYLDTIVRFRKVYKSSLWGGGTVFSEADAHQAQSEIIGVRDEILG